MAKPKELRIRMYNVGFGDCFLLTFGYTDGERHVLIDFGSTAGPVRRKTSMEEVADNIDQTTGGRLDAVVITHRHADHISGFTPGKKKDKGKGSGDVIARLASKALIIQPWTEDPKIGTKARSPKSLRKSGEKSLSALHVQTLDDMQSVAEAIRDRALTLDPKQMDSELSEERPLMSPPNPTTSGGEADDVSEPAPARATLPQFAIGERLRERLAFLGETNLKNLDAVRNINSMSKRHEYLSYGAKTALGGEVLPGVTVHVLGPPTIEQHEQVLTQRERDADEFWQLQAAASRVAANPNGLKLFPNATSVQSNRLPESVRWFVRKLRAIHAQELLEIVRLVDDALNNTSVILLFEIGDKLLLFPGDAQIEDWEFALEYASDKDKKLALLSAVDLYKVGHHGSLNATPKTLWKAFKNKPKMISMMSTRPGKHGNKKAQTEVPRETLVDALKRGSKLRSTAELKGAAADTLFVDVTVDLSS